MDEIHIHCEPIDCPKCQGGKMVPCLTSEIYKSKSALNAHYEENCSPAEFSHRPEMTWKCVNCGHEIIPGQAVPQAHGGLTKTGDSKEKNAL